MSVVLITGANRGLGFELTRQYLSAGGRVLATCRDPSTALRLEGLTQDSKERLSIVRRDVTDAETIRLAAREIDPTAIDVLIKCGDQRTD